VRLCGFGVLFSLMIVVCCGNGRLLDLPMHPLGQSSINSSEGSGARAPLLASHLMVPMGSADAPSGSVSTSVLPQRALITGDYWKLSFRKGDGFIDVYSSGNEDILTGTQLFSLNGQSLRTLTEFAEALLLHGKDPNCGHLEVQVRDPRNRQMMRRCMYRTDAARLAIQAEWQKLPLNSTDEILRVDEFFFGKQLCEGDVGVDWLDSTKPIDKFHALESARLRLTAALQSKSANAQFPLAEEECVIRIVVSRESKKYCLQLMPVLGEPDHPAELPAGAPARVPSLLNFNGFQLRAMQLVESSTSAPLATRDLSLAGGYSGSQSGSGASMDPSSSPGARHRAIPSASPKSSDILLSIDSEIESSGLRWLACSNHTAVVSSGVCTLCRSTLCWRCLTQGEHALAGKILCSECQQYQRRQRRAAQRSAVQSLSVLAFFIVAFGVLGLFLLFTSPSAGSTQQTAGILIMVLVYMLAGNLLIPSVRSHYEKYPPEELQSSPWKWSNEIKFGDAQKQIQAIFGRR
jgi:hypothetical protein